MSDKLKYLNAINILASAKIDALQTIYDVFGGDWERAWNSDLRKYLPKDLDYRLKPKIDPDKEWAKLQREGIELITIKDKSYPKLLKHIPHPPFLLYVRGSHDVWRKQCFAVVGTRAITEYGKRAAQHVVLDLARAGLVVVSGLMYGADELAHKAALEAGAKTIAVLGSGLDEASIAPRRNVILARKIVAEGSALISEYASGTHGSQFTFPQRDRIISGLSKGVLVIEADIKSGAMITAKFALDQNRDVFAIPGSIFAKTSEGTNNIIKMGAKLVSCAEDILEEYDISFKKENVRIKGDNEFEEKILAVLSSELITVDDIIRQTGLEAAQVNATLIVMELAKKIKNLDGRFVLNN